MPATNIQANWDNVEFNSSALTQIDDVSFDKGGDVEYYAGDMDVYDTVAAVLKVKPTATIETSNPAQFMGLTPGTTGTLTATHADARLAAGGGIIYTLSNACFVSAKTNGPHASFGKCTAEFGSISSDGLTSPLAFTRTA